MNLGKVCGTVVCTHKVEGLKGFKLLVVEVLSPKGEMTGGYAVAVDTVGAGFGEIVLLCSGSSARQTPETNGKPVDSAIVAKVDKIDLFQP